MLILKSLLQPHQLLNIDLFSLSQLVVGSAKSFYIAIAVSLMSERRLAAIRQGLNCGLFLFDGIVGIVFGVGREINFRRSFTIHLSRYYKTYLICK